MKLATLVLFFLASCKAQTQHSLIVSEDEINYEKVTIWGGMAEHKTIKIDNLNNLQLICKGETAETISIVSYGKTSKEAIRNIVDYLRACGWSNIDDRSYLSLF